MSATKAATTQTTGWRANADLMASIALVRGAVSASDELFWLTLQSPRGCICIEEYQARPSRPVNSRTGKSQCGPRAGLRVSALALREDHVQREVQALVRFHRRRLRHRIGPADHLQRRLVIGGIAGAFDHAHRYHVSPAVEHEANLDLGRLGVPDLGVA